MKWVLLLWFLALIFLFWCESNLHQLHEEQDESVFFIRQDDTSDEYSETSEIPIYFESDKYEFLPHTRGNFYVTWTLSSFQETKYPHLWGDEIEPDEEMVELWAITTSDKTFSFPLWERVWNYLISRNQKRIDTIDDFRSDDYSFDNMKFWDMEQYLNDGKEHTFHIMYDDQSFESEPWGDRSPVVYWNMVR